MNDFKKSERSTYIYKIISNFTFNFLTITIPDMAKKTKTSTLSIFKELILSLFGYSQTLFTVNFPSTIISS